MTHFKRFYVLHLLLISLPGVFHISIFLLPCAYIQRKLLRVLSCPLMLARSVLNGQVNKMGMKILMSSKRYYNTDLFYKKQVSAKVLSEKHLC